MTALDANAEHVEAIRARGLQVDGKNPRVVQIEATCDPTALRGAEFDAVIFLIKSKMTAAALSQLRPVLAGNPPLVTLQNGIGNAEVLLSASEAVVIRGVTMNAARYVDAGRVESLIEGKTWLGPARGSVEDARPLADLLSKGGMQTEVIGDPMSAVWSKFVFNCVMNPLGALMMGDNASRYNSSDLHMLIDDMAAECEAVVRALGGTFAFAPMDHVEKIRTGQIALDPVMPVRWPSISSEACRPKSTN